MSSSTNASYRTLKQRTLSLKGFSAEDDRYVAMDLVNPTIDEPEISVGALRKLEVSWGYKCLDLDRIHPGPSWTTSRIRRRRSRVDVHPRAHS
jgi:hypothetical protein